MCGKIKQSCDRYILKSSEEEGWQSQIIPNFNKNVNYIEILKGFIFEIKRYLMKREQNKKKLEFKFSLTKLLCLESYMRIWLGNNC